MVNRVIFVGYMGIGKTTFGRALAKELGLTFYDLDWYISSRRMKSIYDLFQELGEEKFRMVEHNMLHEVAEFENVVISCGGGTPCFFDNMDYMNRQAETIYLKADVNYILHHLIGSRNQRPLLHDKTPEQLRDYVTAQLEEREHFYLKAKHVIELPAEDIRQPLDEIKRLLA